MLFGPEDKHKGAPQLYAHFRINGGIVYAEPYAPKVVYQSMLPTKKRHLLGSIFWGLLGAFSSQLFNRLNRMERGLGSA